VGDLIYKMKLFSSLHKMRSYNELSAGGDKFWGDH
jgi:hypothetical protein